MGEEIMIRRRNDYQKMTVSGDQGDLTGMFGFLAASEQATLITLHSADHPSKLL